MSFAHVGIVGVGNMGGAMAQRLADLGTRVPVCDQNESKNAFFTQKGHIAGVPPRFVATYLVANGQPHPLIVVCVVDAAQTRQVLWGADGLVDALPAGSTVMLCPTIAPFDAADCAAELARSGLRCIEAPMSGGPARARAGTMSLMVAGAQSLIAQQQHVLDALANPVINISPTIGDAARTKLVNNLLAAINLVGAAEVTALAERVGLDPNRTWDVIEQSSGASWIGSERMRRALSGNEADLAPRAHMSLLAKDSALASAMADAAQALGPLGAIAAQTFAAALEAGYRDLDDAHMLRFVRERLASQARG